MTDQIVRSKCDALLETMLGKEFAIKWWNSPNKAFDNNIPEMIFNTEPESVYAYLTKSDEGEW
jgi:hypothetical protein